jgi:hypothetical protein
MPIPITRFKCSYCKKHYSAKSDTAKHEKKCLNNSVNKSCSTYVFAVGDWCSTMNFQIFIKGAAVRDCDSWIKNDMSCFDEQ